jgi:hypothetical protein
MADHSAASASQLKLSTHPAPFGGKSAEGQADMDEAAKIWPGQMNSSAEEWFLERMRAVMEACGQPESLAWRDW